MTELEAWLRLWHTPKVGPRTFNFLRSKFTDLCEIFTHSCNELVNQGIPHHIADAIVHNHPNTYKNDISWLNAHVGNNITLISQPHYPAYLKEISDPPPIIYSTGDLEILKSIVNIAIVGGRSASPLGKKIAFNFARELADLGVVIISGLARGIDGQAHEGALNNNAQSTVAVLANGLDRIYPPEHRTLAKRISRGGLIITEFPPGAKPLAHHFPRRNRIISGLALGTLVIEAAQKSGSLITAKYALEQGREVFATPGPINSPLNEGSHHLIQQGAKLTTRIDDILEEIANMIEFKYKISSKNCLNNHQNLDAPLGSLLNLIEYTPLPIEKIIEKSGLTPERVSSMLTELELGGHIAADAFGQYSRI